MKYLPDDIIKEWGLENLSSEEQVSAIEKINQILFQAILSRSLDLLQESEVDELEKIMEMDETTPEIILQFLYQKIPNLEKVRVEEVNNLKQSILVHRNS
mgnify:CR=1 FL=1